MGEEKQDRDGEAAPDPRSDRPSNSAPDAVKDPNAKNEGKPGAAPQGGEVDPGGG